MEKAPIDAFDAFEAPSMELSTVDCGRFEGSIPTFERRLSVGDAEQDAERRQSLRMEGVSEQKD